MRLELLEAGGGRDVVIIRVDETREHYRRRLRRWRRAVREQREAEARLNAPGNVQLTEQQRKLLTPQQLRQFRLLNQSSQLDYQRQLQHSIMEHRREVEEAREKAERQRRHIYNTTGAASNPAPLYVPVQGNPMNAVMPMGYTLPTVKRRRTAGLPPRGR